MRAEEIARFGHWELSIDEKKMRASKGQSAFMVWWAMDWPLLMCKKFPCLNTALYLNKELCKNWF